ncbi:hypothetical protein DFH08DRAFT_391292 [Mycena albidolilacea]|uniref:Uncharacterized protein n=1 Tax=Mycena albidolilacea TaxID=1033008 RepID=A0AAD6ZF83_9AGAR|nr:hypothetical protein DFH08DRAFT_391292 [Mycena albidolilacea]
MEQSSSKSHRDISASGYLLYFPGYYSRSLFVTPPDVVSRARAAFFRRLIFLRVCFYAPSPSDGAAYTYGQIPRGALVLGDPLSTTRARDKGCSFIFAGAVRIILWEGDVAATALRAPPRPRLDPVFGHRPPHPRPGLLVAARLDLPIRALLLRFVASPVCFAPGLRMRSSYRRTCTVCIRIPIRIPPRLPKHRHRKQDRAVEHNHLLPAPPLPPRTGRSGCGWECALRVTMCSCVARPWPAAGEDPSAGVGAETLPRKTLYQHPRVHETERSTQLLVIPSSCLDEEETQSPTSVRARIDRVG